MNRLGLYVARCAGYGLVLLSLLIALQSKSVTAQQTTSGFDFSTKLPRIDPVEPKEVLSTFDVTPGYKMELVASEPMVQDPIAMSFDEHGRLFVIEMCDYSEQDTENLGVVRMLEDTDHDGAFDQSFAFAEGLSWPTAIFYCNGGVLVGAPPELWFFKDTDGDNKADIKQKLYTGFGRQNVQGLMNSFVWGIDNRIYCSSSSNGGLVKRLDQSDDAGVVLNGRDFSLDPNTFDLRAENGGGQHGMSFDDYGRRFTCNNSDHLQTFVYPDRYPTRDEWDSLPTSKQSIATDGPQAEVYRISPIEPWRILRTAMRASGAVKGLTEGGGRPAGFFTSATGVTIYRGDAMPELRGTAFIGDVGSNIVHRKRIDYRGVLGSGHRLDDNREFIASKDIWFRPCQFANSPDGCLYIADIYREVIEHPKSLPEDIKKHLDLTSGRDRGRIYRVVPESFQARPYKSLADLDSAALVALLEHDNGWHRDTACRLILERKDQSVTNALVSLLQSSMHPLARLHALSLLRSSDQLNDALLAKCFADNHPSVRAHAYQIAEDRLPDSKDLQDALIQKIATDSDYSQFSAALAWSVQRLPHPGLRNAILAMLERSSSDLWYRTAAIKAVDDGDVLPLILALAEKPNTTDACKQLCRYMVSLNRREDLDAINTWMAAMAANPKALPREVIVRGALPIWVTYKIRSSDVSAATECPLLAAAVADLIEDASRSCNDNATSESEMIDAIEVVALIGQKQEVELLKKVMEESTTARIQQAAAVALERIDEPTAAESWIACWGTLLPSVQQNLLQRMVARKPSLDVLLSAIEQEHFSLSEISPSIMDRLKSLDDAVQQSRVVKLIATFGKAIDANRQQVIDDYRSSLSMAGDIEKGKAVFQKQCSACHRVDGVGYEFGPNLVSYKYRGTDAILTHVLDPNREVNPRYVNYIAKTRDDRIVNGMLDSETASSITLLRGDNYRESIAVANIAELKNTQKSIMPEGMEQQIDHHAMADLLAYLMSTP